MLRRPRKTSRSTRIVTRKRRKDLAAVLALFGLCAGCASRPPSAPAPGPSAPPLRKAAVAGPRVKFEGDLLARLEGAPDSRPFTVLVDLSEQVDLPRLRDALRSSGASKAERRDAVVRALERVAGRQQARLRPELDRLLAEGQLDYAREVAVVNRVLVEGRPSGLIELSRHPDVAAIRPDWSRHRSAGATTGVAPQPRLGERFTSWAIADMGADRLWREGLDGSGVVVAIIDSGVAADHEQLRGRMLEGERGWYDPVRSSRAPYDSDAHGTMVLSVAVGSNPDGRAMGVAPGARWAAALANWENFYARSRMTLAADWVLRVARPDVLITAWHHDEGDCTDFDLPFIDAWRAAEIFVVFPAGNSGPDAARSETPASLVGELGPVFSVAALTPRGDVYRLSTRGPSTCGSPSFPSLSAPGAEVPHAVPFGTSQYLVGSGTSLAAGLVGGGAALLLQEDPELGSDDIERILLETARDLPPGGRDDATGAGAVDLVRALARVRSRRTAAPRGDGP